MRFIPVRRVPQLLPDTFQNDRVPLSLRGGARAKCREGGDAATEGVFDSEATPVPWTEY